MGCWLQPQRSYWFRIFIHGWAPVGPAGPVRIPVAILKHASNLLLDEVERGAVEKLASEGYREGERIELKRFSAEGDLPTANATAKRITDGSFRVVISISTLSLQAVAGANRDGRGVQVFWTGADVTVLNAAASLFETARKGKVPVFSNTSGQVREGWLFDLGANDLDGNPLDATGGQPGRSDRHDASRFGGVSIRRRR